MGGSEKEPVWKGRTMNRAWKALCLTILATAPLTGCIVDLDLDGPDHDRIYGSGHIATEFRQLPSFTALSVSGVGRVVIERSDQPFVEITADDNVIHHLESDVRGGMLTLGMTPGVSFSDIAEIVYYVGVPYLDELLLSGVVRGEAYQMDTDDLYVELSGTTSLRVEGWARRQTVLASGTASYWALDLESVHAQLITSGTATATVWVHDRLDATASGVSWIEYDGNPALDLHISGLASVRHY